jgi:hypothetical protein
MPGEAHHRQAPERDSHAARGAYPATRAPEYERKRRYMLETRYSTLTTPPVAVT